VCTHAPPHVLQYCTQPPSQGGLQSCHVSSGSGPRLPDRKGFDAATCIVAPDPLGGLRCTACPTDPNPASLLGGLRVATHPTVPCGPHASDIKKSLAGHLVQLGSHVPNARVHVSKAPDVRVIMGLQDVRAGSAVNAYKMCRQTTTV
jgi:hypothetical protein